jgi:hypothetical protein
MVFESEDRQALGRQIIIPNDILLFSLVGKVSRTIALDHQLRFGTKEIADVSPKLMLPPKLGSTQLAIS